MKLGGRYVPEILYHPLVELEKSWNTIKNDDVFWRDFRKLLKEYVGRPTPLYFAKNLSSSLGFKVYLKREDLCHTGAHKINNTLGQCFLAKKMGKSRVIAETGAGQHGVATAVAAALLGLECVIFMGEEDVKRQSLNVFRMELLGAKVVPVSSGSKTLKDAINEALRDWAKNVDNTHYVIGSVVGPHPFPEIVRTFQSIIGKETKSQIMELEGRLPTHLIACVGGGSNALGLFYPFEKENVKFIGVEAEGAATLSLNGKMGVLHGFLSLFIQDENGQIKPTNAIAAGLDYPGVGPDHVTYKITGRAKYFCLNRYDAIKGFKLLCKLEGIIPALESAHAVGWLIANRDKFREEDIAVVCLSGRGDKDVELIKKLMGNSNG